MRPITDAEIARRVTVAIDQSGDGERARLVDRAASTGSAVENGTQPLLEDGDQVVQDGTVYQLSVQQTEQRPATRYQVTINDLAYDSVTTEPGAGRIQFPNLPAVDREQFRNVGLEDGDPLGIGTNFMYTDPEREESVLVPTPEYSVVVWGPDQRARFSVDGSHRVTVRTYRYATEQVATAEAYGQRLREEYGFELADLSAGEQDIVAAAIETDDRYTVPHTATPPAAFQSLAERFRPHASPSGVREAEQRNQGQISGTYLVRCEGDVYWTRLFLSEEVRETTDSQ